MGRPPRRSGGYVGVTCPACAAARANPLTGALRAGCSECLARDISRGPEHWQARRVGQITAAYRAVLERSFGEAWKAGHERVKAWAASDTSMAV